MMRGGGMMGGGVRLLPQGTLAHLDRYPETGVKKKLNGFNYISVILCPQSSFHSLTNKRAVLTASLIIFYDTTKYLVFPFINR